MKKVQKYSKETRVGLVALVAFGLLYGGVSFLKGEKFFSFNQNKYYVLYNHAGGLYRGQAVFLKGIRVGEVRKIKVDYAKSQPIKAELLINKRIPLTTTTVARLLGYGILGQYVINLELHEGGTPLANRSELKGAVSQNFTDEIAAHTGPVLNDIRTTSSLVHDLATNLAKNQEAITQAILNLEAATRGIRNYVESNQAALEKGTRSAAVLLQALSHKKYGIAPLVQNLTSITEELKHDTFKHSLHHLEGTLSALEQVTQKMLREDNSLGLLLHDRKLYDELYLSAHETQQLLRNVRRFPSRYFHVSLIGRRPAPLREERTELSVQPSED